MGWILVRFLSRPNSLCILWHLESSGLRNFAWCRANLSRSRETNTLIVYIRCSAAQLSLVRLILLFAFLTNVSVKMIRTVRQSILRRSNFRFTSFFVRRKRSCREIERHFFPFVLSVIRPADTQIFSLNTYVSVDFCDSVTYIHIYMHVHVHVHIHTYAHVLISFSYLYVYVYLAIYLRR